VTLNTALLSRPVRFRARMTCKANHPTDQQALFTQTVPSRVPHASLPASQRSNVNKPDSALSRGFLMRHQHPSVQSFPRSTTPPPSDPRRNREDGAALQAAPPHRKHERPRRVHPRTQAKLLMSQSRSSVDASLLGGQWYWREHLRKENWMLSLLGYGN